MPRGYDFSVSFLGKAATWVLYVGIGLLLVTNPSREWPLWVFYIGLGMAVAAGVLYAVSAWRETRTVKAVVMAGGEGTRLRPLTSNQPKPMVPIVGKPCMEHILELLRKHGFDDVIVTLAFLPQAIRSYFGDGEALGLQRSSTRSRSRRSAPPARSGSPRGSSTTPCSSSRATRSATSTWASCWRSTARRARR